MRGGPPPPRMPGSRILRSSSRGTQVATTSAAAASPSSGSPRAAARCPCLVSVPSSPSSCRSSSSSCSPPPSAKSAAYGATPSWRDIGSPFRFDGDGWGSDGAASGREELGGFWYAEGFVFGSPPSEEEVEEAVSTLQQIFIPATFSQATADDAAPPSNRDRDRLCVTSNDITMLEECSTAESRRPDWIEPRLRSTQSESAQSQGRNRLVDALHSMQVNSSVQRMVVSLSSDKAVWAAVMKNEAVRELRQSLCSDESKDMKRVGVRPEAACKLLTCMLLSTRAKLLKFLQQITKLVNGLLCPKKKRKMDAIEESIRSSFMVSMVVFIVVVIFRVHKY